MDRLLVIAVLIVIAWIAFKEYQRSIAKNRAATPQSARPGVAPAVPSPNAVTKRPHWPPTGEFPVNAVGESFYRNALEKLVRSTDRRTTLMYATAILRPEPSNPHDVNAVSVAISGEQVAYLSREDAAEFRARLGDLGPPLEITSCDVVVRGGYSADGRPLDYSVQLDFDLKDKPSLELPPTYDRPKWVHPDASIQKRSAKELVLNIPLAPGFRPDLTTGDELTAWTKPHLPGIHFFAPGSIGGQGRIIVIDKDDYPDLAAHIGNAEARVVSVDGTCCRAIISW